MTKILIEDIESVSFAENEAYKTLRTNILCCDKDIKTILFTSGEAETGKTPVSLETALSLAEIGRKVLYLDCDMRKAGLISRYNLNGKVNGLSQLLSNKQAVPENYIYETSVPNFYVTFSGPIPRRPTELLEIRTFHRFMKMVREWFEYVIVDSPALGTVIDSVIIARECDGVILVIQHKEEKKKLDKIIGQLRMSGVEIMGAVLNKVPEKGSQ